MEYIEWMVFLLLIPALGSWLRGRKWYETELESNEVGSPRKESLSDVVPLQHGDRRHPVCLRRVSPLI